MKIYEKQLIIITLFAMLTILSVNMYQVITETIPEHNYTNIGTSMQITGQQVANMATDPLSAIGMLILIIIFCAFYAVYGRSK